MTALPRTIASTWASVGHSHPKLAVVGSTVGAGTAVTANVLTGDDHDLGMLAGIGIVAGAAAGAAVLRSSMACGPKLAPLAGALTGIGFGGTLGLGSRALQNSMTQRERSPQP